jgi:transposase
LIPVDRKKSSRVIIFPKRLFIGTLPMNLLAPSIIVFWLNRILSATLIISSALCCPSQSAQVTPSFSSVFKIYWKPVFYILKKHCIESFVLNPYHIKAIPGKKSDKIDSGRIAHLSMHGLVKHSFVPGPVIMNLRTLTRARFNMISQVRVIKNTISRILDESNIKFNSVASDLFGVSGKLIMKAVIDNPNISSLELTALVKGKLNNRKSELIKALDGTLSKENLILLPIYLNQLENLKNSIAQVEGSIKQYIAAQNLSRYIDILCSIPSISFISAAVILAEIGTDMAAM